MQTKKSFRPSNLQKSGSGICFDYLYGTWNVRTMYDGKKLKMVVIVIKWYGQKVIGLAQRKIISLNK
jgi:hypothetical protein